MTTQEITKVQELIYTTRVETVMAADVIVLKPEMSMSEVKNLMRSMRIAGAPVMDGDRILGMVSLSDVMDAMEKGRMDTPVVDNMTKEVKTVLKDASVTEAIHNLGRQGFGRLPVVDRDGKLVGIVTTGTVIRALLHEMDVSFQRKEAEKIQTYRASHIFEDISSDDTSLILRYVVDDKDFANAGKASSMIKKSLQRLGVLPSIIRRVAVAVYEAEMNLVIHTDVGGEIIVDIREDRLMISAVDHGPGIEDLAQVLQPGYSTAPEWIRDMGFGAGMGLANIKRCSDTMSLRSELGGGTRLDIVFIFGQNALRLRAASGKKS
ncbi:MAG: CBS domain-containing protein [Desulfomonile tiedjei]|uniref:CBS domain-containing protein n=1 Tax=Desulfomonile tiedjei TaxID=2358 RepID=A0A9D6V378_9BACT|nr:CBS domain-containing protein [Desulfomonile tiedjei]